ncbi:MAG: DUF3883 domain-containing protein [Selenomonadaceae bacterium]|nr:DUF3883 domain-containing protein [Selenomonadaceae bacterium]
MKTQICICFDKDAANIQGQVPAAFISPGHPLLSAMSDLIREKYGNDLKQGKVFVDDSDDGKEMRLLFYIENSIQDGIAAQNGQRRVISKRVHFVKIRKNGNATTAGYAPYLDYHAPTEEERNRIFAMLSEEDWLKNNVEDIAVGYAIQNIIPAHLEEVSNRKKAMLDKMENAVKERLTSEIRYWDFCANELREKESMGKRNAKLNADQAAKRAEELTARLEKRLSEIAQERKITAMSPIVVGGALVIPKGWFEQEKSKEHSSVNRSEVERIAMQTVLNIERGLGFSPKDVSAEKCGYDIESFVPEELRKEGNCLRFIEVKGRRADADTVTVSKNEILTALNKPDEYILAIVLIEGKNTQIFYLKNPFKTTPDFSATSINYNIKKLINDAKIIYKG